MILDRNLEIMTQHNGQIIVVDYSSIEAGKRSGCYLHPPAPGMAAGAYEYQINPKIT